MTPQERDVALREAIDSCVLQGRPIEAGWAALCVATIPEGAPAEQLEMMRTSYFLGAQHLYNILTTMMTCKDSKLLRLIETEMRAFGK